MYGIQSRERFFSFFLGEETVMVADDHVHCPLIEPNLFYMNIRERLSFICTV